MTRTDRFDLPAGLSSPAECATDLGLDLDGDGSRYYPAPLAPLVRAVVALVLVMRCVALAVWAPEWLATWLRAALGRQAP